jgi:hypothetical protein
MKVQMFGVFCPPDNIVPLSLFGTEAYADDWALTSKAIPDNEEYAVMEVFAEISQVETIQEFRWVEENTYQAEIKIPRSWTPEDVEVFRQRFSDRLNNAPR